nr:hypothetical protein [Tanacetum cinerariifolium]
MFKLLKVAILEAEQIKLATKRSKKDFHISHASGSDNGVDTQSKILDEQQQKTFGTDEGTDNNDDNGENDDHHDDSDDERTESNSDEILDLNLTNIDQTEYEEEDVNERVCIPSDDTEITNEEKLDNEEIMDDEEDDKVIKEMYDDVNVILGNDDT